MYRVRITITGAQGTPWVATHFLDDQGGNTAADAVLAVGALWDNLMQLATDNVSYTSGGVVETVDETTGQPTGLTAVTPETGIGQLSNDPLPWATQMVCQWRTGIFVSGREVRGRTFVPGLTEASNTDGVPYSGTMTQLNGYCASYAASLNATPFVYSRQHHVGYPIVAGTAWDQFAVLRSRRD